MWSSRSGRAPPAQSGSCRGPAHTQAQGGSNEDKTRQTEEGAGVGEEPGEACWTESPRMAPGYSQDGAGVAGGQGSLCRDLLTQHLRSPQQQD